MQIWCNVEAQAHGWESKGQNVGEKIKYFMNELK